MFVTGILLIRYWLLNKKLIEDLKIEETATNKMIFFGICSAIFLIIHSIFLGINFDNDLYKFFRRAIMLIFIIFEITAQAYYVAILYSLKNKLLRHINLKILKIHPANGS